MCTIAPRCLPGQRWRATLGSSTLKWAGRPPLAGMLRLRIELRPAKIHLRPRRGLPPFLCIGRRGELACLYARVWIRMIQQMRLEKKALLEHCFLVKICFFACTAEHDAQSRTRRHTFTGSFSTYRIDDINVALWHMFRLGPAWSVHAGKPPSMAQLCNLWGRAASPRTCDLS
jgi:hypothetical protein